jgi:hypothetical protein
MHHATSALSDKTQSCKRGKSQILTHQSFERESGSSVVMIATAPATAARMLNTADPGAKFSPS